MNPFSTVMSAPAKSDPQPSLTPPAAEAKRAPEQDQDAGPPSKRPRTEQEKVDGDTIQKDENPTAPVAGPSKAAEDDKDDAKAEGPVVTMLDVLEDEAALEEDAEAVLGGADDQHCTYMTGGQYCTIL